MQTVPLSVSFYFPTNPSDSTLGYIHTCCRKAWECGQLKTEIISYMSLHHLFRAAAFHCQGITTQERLSLEPEG